VRALCFRAQHSTRRGAVRCCARRQSDRQGTPGRRTAGATRRGDRTRLPDEGFTDERRLRIQDPDTGEVVAELDIVIKGPLGSSSVAWLIECRDRPSDRPAPASWIEQLVTRRARFSFDFVVAVSTTGFSAQAEKLAERHGIRVRTVRTIEDLANDFGIVDLALVENGFQPTGPLRIVGHLGRLPETKEQPSFKRPGAKEFVVLSMFVLDILRAEQAAGRRRCRGNRLRVQAAQPNATSVRSGGAP